MLRKGRVFHAVTPATRTSCYYFFGMGVVPGSDVEASKRFLEPVIAEDIFASEEIEKMIVLAGGHPEEFMLKSDRGTVEGRRLLQSMMDAENGVEPAAKKAHVAETI